ncbi:unnamed protein product [Heligmosomoides polygyrus]|uniref:DDE_3 domain-containing protein n=1 Tax=Heligmosomoides polygyrus TaxID=6339 RepID=A0A183FK15_HELPZ|nr:unnamed protein product [Heligmosomoides polygyrus]
MMQGQIFGLHHVWGMATALPGSECESGPRCVSKPSLRLAAERKARKAKFPNFIMSGKWPPHSPDYDAWSILKATVRARSQHSLEAQRESRRLEWERLSPADLQPIAINLTKLFDFCICTQGTTSNPVEYGVA